MEIKQGLKFVQHIAYHNLSRLKFKHKSSIEIRRSNYRNCLPLKDLIVALQHKCFKQIHLLALHIRIEGYNVLLQYLGEMRF